MDIKKSIKNVQKQLYIKKLRKPQIKPMNSILNHQDTFVIAPTSFGKSMIFLIPAIIYAHLLTIIIEPTLSLMHDQVRKLRECGIVAEYLDSTMEKKQQQEILKQISAGKVNILYVTPEQFTSESFLCTVENAEIYMVVVDECHCVLDWGYSFRNAYLRIGETIDSLKHRPIVSAFTATATSEDQKQIAALLHMRDTKVYQNSLYRENLTFMKSFATDRTEKRKLLKKYLHKYHTGASVVYCNTKKAVDAVYEFLKEKYPDQVVKSHSSMKPKTRAENERAFICGEKSIMVATSAFGMGIDHRDVDLVVHFNMPLSLTDYIQQAGRAGRNEQNSHCILLYSEDDYYVNRMILEQMSSETAYERAFERLDEIKEYCDNQDGCLQQLLLNAFGEYREKSCKHCTNCQKNRRR